MAKNPATQLRLKAETKAVSQRSLDCGTACWTGTEKLMESVLSNQGTGLISLSSQSQFGRNRTDIFYFNFFKKPEKSGKMKKRLKTHQFDLAPTHVESSSGTPEAETKKRKLGELRKFFTKICVNYK